MQEYAKRGKKMKKDAKKAEKRLKKVLTRRGESDNITERSRERRTNLENDTEKKEAQSTRQ